MNYGEIKKCDIANGEGVRVALFVSGCRHHCKGCFNSMTWDFNYGKKFTKETEEEILEALKPNYIDGLSLLGRTIRTGESGSACEAFKKSEGTLSGEEYLVLQRLFVR